MTRSALPLLLFLVAVAGLAEANPELEGPYRIEGASGGQRYTLAGGLEYQGNELRFARGPLRGKLSWDKGAWRGTSSSTGLSGALTGGAAGQVTLELVRTAPQRLDVRWSLVNGARQTQGSEVWTRAPIASAPEASAAMSDLKDHVLRAAGRKRGSTIPAAEVFSDAGNRIGKRVLVDGPEIFAAAARLIESAEEEVLLQSFHWQDGCQAADALVAGLQRLQERRRAAGAARPVRVHVVVDHNRLIKELRKNPDELAASIARANLDPRYVVVQQSKHSHWLYGALHSKTLVVDGQRALIQSANVHDAQNGPIPWREFGFELAGPIAKAFRSDFVELWRQTRGDRLPALTTPPLQLDGGVPMMAAVRPWGRSVFSRNVKDAPGQAILQAINNAQQRVRIITPQFSAKPVREALVAALRRGVQIELLLSKGGGGFRMKLPGQGGTSQKNLGRLYEDLKSDPAALARLDARWYSRDGVQPVEKESTPGALHAKYMTVDDQLAVVGASNLDNQSFYYSRETNVVVDSRETVIGWDAQVFTPNFSRSIRIDLSKLD
ncbi:MAG TPA: hypothetical protein DEA08_01540 [Planctomycetes bacterium]|nr:hypothetical protein [Planctomycetota bacterium]